MRNILFFLLLSVSGYSQKLSGNSLSVGNVIISHTNTALHYHGRWNNNGTGMTSGWASSFVRIRFKNTSQITLNLYSENTNSTTANSAIVYTLDQGYDYLDNYTICASGATFTGEKNISIPVTNDGTWHEAMIYLGGGFPNQQNKVTANVLKNVLLDKGGLIEAPTRGTKKIQCIGDSWTFVATAWQKYFGMNTYDLYQISNGGLTLSDMNSYYNYDYTTPSTLNTTDPIANAIILSYGVNDFTQGVTVGTFQTTLLSLIDKIQLKQPGVKIFLVRIPNNGVYLYGQYGTAMSNAAGLRSNVIYVDTSSLDASMVFHPDIYHMDQNSRIALANFVKAVLTANGI